MSPGYEPDMETVSPVCLRKVYHTYGKVGIVKGGSTKIARCLMAWPECELAQINFTVTTPVSTVANPVVSVEIE